MRLNIPTLADRIQEAPRFEVEQSEDFDFASLSLEGLERAERTREPDPREAGRALLLSVCEKQAYSTADLADVLGCSRRHADRIKNGECFLSVKGAVRLAKATGVSPIALLGLSGYEAKPA
jgi:plasmid maintenance system antidote protein VapI